MKNIKATQESIKEHNFGLILRNIKEEEQITRIKLNKITGLAKSTVSDLVNYLIRIEAVTEAIYRPCLCQNEYITYVSAKKEIWK